MTPLDADRSVLPNGLADLIEETTGGKLVSIVPHSGAGVSREGCFVAIELGDGPVEAYLSYDVRRTDDSSRADYCRREASALRLAVDRGLRAPTPIGRWPERLAILTRKLPGKVSIDHLDMAGRITLAQDYIREIAKLHRIEVTGLELDGFGPPPVDARDYARARVDFLRARHQQFGNDDPLNVLLYRWLDENLPKEAVRPVIVHGDVGPANFLHDDKRVTAVLDWEQCHYGDPMEDFGWLLLRSALFPFVPLAPLVQAWEEAHGTKLDPSRIFYYRLLAQAGVLTDQCGQMVQSDGPMLGNSGRVFIYYLAIRKLTLIALAEAEGLDLNDGEPASSEPSWDRLFRLALGEIDDKIVPRSTDAVAGARADGLKSLIHYWRGREMYGGELDRREHRAIEAVLNRPFDDLDGARIALAHGIDNKDVSIADALGLCQLRSAGEVACARAGMGALADLSYPRF